MTDTTASRILVADDQPDVLKAVRLLLKSNGIDADLVSSPAAVIERLGQNEYDLLLIDLNYTRDTTSGQEGLELLSHVQEIDSTLPVVVFTAWSSIDLAVEAMRRGARDFVEKPWENERLLAVVRKQIDLARAIRKGRLLDEELGLLRGEGMPTMLAQSHAMQPVLHLMARISNSDANVLITGENGTGKGLVARILHGNSSRRDRPMVTVDAASLPETVFESEVFGHVRGAYTDARSDRVGRIEVASGGTLFFDEIGNVPLKLQGKLLRVVEIGEFERVGCSKTRRSNVRIIAATNADLHQAVADGAFRQDLLFRLNTVEVHLPPLRARQEDIPLLASHFLAQHTRRYAREIQEFDSAALHALLAYSWPGNVRELDHTVERAVLMAQGQTVTTADLGLAQKRAASLPRLEDLPLEDVERVLVQKAMARCQGNITLAAAALGLSRTALYRRLEKHGLLARNRPDRLGTG